MRNFWSNYRGRHTNRFGFHDRLAGTLSAHRALADLSKCRSRNAIGVLSIIQPTLMGGQVHKEYETSRVSPV